MNNENDKMFLSARGPYMIDYDSLIRERGDPLTEVKEKAIAEQAYQEIKKLAFQYYMQKTSATVEGF